MSQLPNTTALILDHEGSALEIGLNRPDARNALSAEIVGELR
jgi:enoyl-CoA hydratase/carnithine racemase